VSDGFPNQPAHHNVSITDLTKLFKSFIRLGTGRIKSTRDQYLLAKA